jgi:hypothetical protein
VLVRTLKAGYFCLVASAAQQFRPELLATGFRPDLPERIPADLNDTDKSTRLTVAAMCRHIREAEQHPLMRRYAREVKARWAAGNPATATAWGVFWFCKSTVRFRSDEAAMFSLLNTTDEYDLLIPPPVLMQMVRPEGDCDDFTMLACTLLRLNRIEPEIVTVACDPNDRRRWSHVYLRAILPDGRRIALDPTNGDYPSWEVPPAHCTRKQIWNMDGQPINAPDSWSDKRLHAYRRRGVGQDSTTVLPSFATWNYGAAPGAVPTMPDASFWNSPALASIINNAFKLGQIAITPSGAVVTQPGFTVANQSALPTQLGGVSLGSVLVWGGLAVAAVMVISAVTRR